jgi:hypothetical protein
MNKRRLCLILWKAICVKPVNDEVKGYFPGYRYAAIMVTAVI